MICINTWKSPVIHTNYGVHNFFTAEICKRFKGENCIQLYLKRTKSWTSTSKLWRKSDHILQSFHFFTLLVNIRISCQNQSFASMAELIWMKKMPWQSTVQSLVILCTATLKSSISVKCKKNRMSTESHSLCCSCKWCNLVRWKGQKDFHEIMCKNKTTTIINLIDSDCAPFRLHFKTPLLCRGAPVSSSICKLLHLDNYTTHCISKLVSK